MSWYEIADDPLHSLFRVVSCGEAKRDVFGFPHWDSRIGKGQKSNYDESTAVIFINTDLAVNGDPARQLPPLRPYLAGSSGTINVSSHIATSYIENIV